jgi:hypothetical protein
MRKSLTRAVAGAAAATAVTLALTGTANATVVPAKLHTTLSIVELRNVIKAGQKDVVSGVLRAGRFGLPREVVVLDRLVGGKFVPVQAGLTNKAGAVGFVVKPKVTARYELVFPGTKKLARTHSGVVTVKVVP